MENFNYNIEELVRNKINRMIDITLDEKAKDLKLLRAKLLVNVASVESMKSSDKLRFDTENRIYKTFLQLSNEDDMSTTDGLSTYLSSLCVLIGKSEDISKVTNKINEISRTDEKLKEITTDQVLKIIEYKSKQISQLNEEIQSFLKYLSNHG